MTEWIINIFRVDDPAPFGARRRRWKDELYAIGRRVDDHKEAVVDNWLAFFVRDLKRLTIQEDANGFIPLRIPNVVRDLVAIRVEPGNILLNDVLAFLMDGAVLKELTAVQVRVCETVLDELAGEIAKPLTRRAGRAVLQAGRQARASLPSLRPRSAASGRAACAVPRPPSGPA